MGRSGRAIAALLALALLILPGAPMRHASAAAAHVHSAGQAVIHQCAGHGEEVASDNALASSQDDHGRTDHHSGALRDLACCAAGQCPATIAVPSMAPAQSVPVPLMRVADFPHLAAPDGIGVDPALHPPRALA